MDGEWVQVPAYKVEDKIPYNYEQTLEKSSIFREIDSMCNADVSVLDAKTVMALLIAAYRAERFCDGVLIEFLENGSILRWLKRLEDLDTSD